jgi:signal transduction histidine kinase
MQPQLYYQLFTPVLFFGVAFVFAIIAHKNPQYAEARLFSASYFFATLGYLTDIFRFALPFAAMETVIDIYYILAAVFFNVALIKRSDLQMPVVILSVASVCAVIAFFYFNFIYNDLWLLTMSMNIFHGGIHALGLALTWRSLTSRMEQIFKWVCAIFSAQFFIQIILVKFADVFPDSYESYAQSNFLLIALLSIGVPALGMAFTLIADYTQKIMQALHNASLTDYKDAQIMNAIHDIRQPLYALRLKMHNLMQGNSAMGEDFDNVKQTFGYLEELISERLASTSGDVTIHRETKDKRDDSDSLSTEAILSGVHAMFENDAQEKGIELVYSKTPVELKFDQLGFMRIVSNLVSNAIKYTDKGEVRFGLSRIGDKVRLSVADTGTGMTQASFDEALKRGVRLEKGDDLAEGNGYGLSIVAELAEQHGLEILLTKDRLNGTEINVDFSGAS